MCIRDRYMGNNKVEKSNYKEIAQQIINEIGTSENLSLIHILAKFMSMVISLTSFICLTIFVSSILSYKSEQ